MLDLVKLADVTNRRVGTYSGGMRRRLDLALALVHEPAILFLDEPTTGLDPASRRDVWSEVRRLNTERGMTIFLTTPYLEEADQLADRIMIVDGGKIAAAGTPDELKAGVGSESISLTFADTTTGDRAREMLMAMATSASTDRTTLRLYLNNAATVVPEVVIRLQEAGMAPTALTLRQPTLDDVFLSVTGQSFDGTPAVGMSE